MPVVVEVEEKISVPVPDESPHTFETSLCSFRVNLKKMKKKKYKAGEIERKIHAESKNLLREAVRKAYQDQADGYSPHCPICGAKLQNVEIRERTILTQWGHVTIRRAYGKCPRCKKYYAPADHFLGLDQNSQTSPDIAEKLTWLNTMVPASQAAEIFEHITGQPISPSKVERESKKKGEEAIRKREEERKRALCPEKRFDFSKENKPFDEPKDFTLVIMIDGWMVRERDHWGYTELLRRRGMIPKRWHEVKSARLFRLDQRACTQSNRPILLDSHRVATREGMEKFSELIYTEAVRMGLYRARDILVIADGGVWIWNIINDRFPYSRGTLDFYHAASHLWAVGNHLFGEGSDEARLWVKSLLHQLRHGDHDRVIKTLSDLANISKELPISEDIEREWKYFESHRDHIDYEAKSSRGEPIGSGAMESACKQYQMRFKRPGQFWNVETEEGLLELVNRRYNCLWHTLWPHLSSQN